MSSTSTAEKRAEHRLKQSLRDRRDSEDAGSSGDRRSALHPKSLLRDGTALAGLYLGPPLTRLRRWYTARVAPILSIMSGLGWGLAAVAVAFWIFGGALGWDEAVVAALAATLLLLIAVAFILGSSAYGVELDLTKTRVAVGDRAVGSVTVSNTSAKTLLPAALELPVGQSTAVFALPRMRPEQQHEDLFTIPTARRAVIVVGPVRSVRADPLHLLRRQMLWTEPTDLFVHPRTVALVGSAAGFIRDLEGLPTRDLSDSDVSFHALRDYVPGDDRRHIHWKTTARTNTLMVRQFEETRRAHLAIAVSTKAEEYERAEDFELAVSVAASIGLQAIREQRNLSVLSQHGPLRTETGRNLLDDMTTVNAGSIRASAVDLARTTADTVPNASVVFFVLGTHVTASALRSAAASVPPGIRCFAIRCDTGASVSRATIGDLTVLSISTLDELPSVLRKAAA